MTHTGYLELKLSWELFQKAPETLGDDERTRLTEVAAKQSHIEQTILASAEAAQVVVPPATLSTRLRDILARYADADELVRDLSRVGLDRAALEDSVERDLRVEAVLERIAAQTPPVSAVEAEIYYRLHPQSFDRPPARRLRHILIACDNSREKDRARAQLDVLRLTAKSAEQFAAAALRHSQCPTALDGGQLGVVKRDQLYPQLDAAAFALGAGQISRVVESPIGLHLVRCDEIIDGGLLPFAEVVEKIIEHLGERRRSQAQRDWIKRCLKA